MDRQNRQLTVLATVLLVLVAIIVLGKQPDDTPSDPDAPPERALFQKLKGDEVTVLTLVNASGTTTFTKRDGDWSMTAPREMAVEQRRVEEIADRFASLKVQEASLPGDLASFGLDAAARITVTLTGADGAARTVYVGRDAPVGYRSYLAETPEGPALLASSQVGDLVKRTPDDFRSREVWKVSTGTAKRVRIEADGAAVVLRKDDNGWWLGDDGPRASERAVEDWLTRASFLRVDQFLDGADAASVGLSPAGAVLTVEDADGTHTLEIGRRDDTGVVARAGTQIVQLGAEAAELLGREGWTADELVPVRAAQVDSIEVSLGGRSARFTKADGTWTDASGAATASAEKLLDALADAKADRTLTGLSTTEAWGSLTLAEGATRKEMVLFGQELPEGGRAAKEAAGGPAFRVPPETVSAILAALP